MTIVPMGDRVLIKKEKAEEKTMGGLILAASAKQESTMAEVLAKGPDAPEMLKIGAKVIYSKFAGSDVIDVDGADCLLVEAKEILAIVE